MNIKGIVTVLLIFLFLPIRGVSTALPVFRVSVVSTVVTPSSYSGNCPVSFIFAAKITVRAKGRVTYRWVDSTGRKGPAESIVFNGADSSVVTAGWEVGEAGKTYTALWKTIEILSPNRLIAPKPLFSLQCADRLDDTLRGDIDVSDISLDPQCRIRITHTNHGSHRVNLVLREMVWINGGLVIDTSELINLAPKASQSHTIGTDPGMRVPDGATVRVWIDVDNTITELNETNNIMSKRIRCNPEKDIVK